MKTAFIRDQIYIIRRKFCSRDYTNGIREWKSVVGLEIHAQLNTESKLFSRARNSFGGVVNSNVSLLDASIPGVLPVLNRRCVELGVLTALALSCRINPISMFDRKHYFYADLPAGYQITQQRAPLAIDGVINFQVYVPGVHKVPYTKSSRIKQIQLEQDSGKSLHDVEQRRSLVDLNRAGAPLIELVFEPDLEDGEEAAALVKELVLVVQRLGACSGRMEEGALRVDANVSLHRPGEPLGMRTEIKNIGSVRGVAGAIKHEVSRQRKLLSNGDAVLQETRAWDADAKVTVPLRDKELVHDYRFMPEPNLPPLRVNINSTDEQHDIVSAPRLQREIPELPEESRQRLVRQFNMRPEVAIQIVNEPVLLSHFEVLVQNSARTPAKITNMLLNELMTILNKKEIDLKDSTITSNQLGELLDMQASRIIDLEATRWVLNEFLDSSVEMSASEIVKEKNWSLVSNEEEIIKICVEVMENNPEIVRKYRNGKVKLLRALLGIVARNTEKKYDMALVSKKMEELLKN